MYQSTSPSGAVTPTVAIPSSICAHTWRPAQYCRSEGRAKRADGAVAATDISPTQRACRLARTERRSHRCHESPGGVPRPVERERPALREGRGAVLRPAHHARRVAVLHVAAPAELDVDGHGRRRALHIDGGDPDALDARTAHDEPRVARGVASV